jgi:hypothetical protein
MAGDTASEFDANKKRLHREWEIAELEAKIAEARQRVVAAQAATLEARWRVGELRKQFEGARVAKAPV